MTVNYRHSFCDELCQLYDITSYSWQSSSQNERLCCKLLPSGWRKTSARFINLFGYTRAKKLVKIEVGFARSVQLLGNWDIFEWTIRDVARLFQLMRQNWANASAKGAISKLCLGGGGVGKMLPPDKYLRKWWIVDRNLCKPEGSRPY